MHILFRHGSKVGTVGTAGLEPERLEARTLGLGVTGVSHVAT